MSNAMPFMLSSSPPPIDDNEEEEVDDEFGDFRVAEHTFAITDCMPNSDSPEPINSWDKRQNAEIINMFDRPPPISDSRESNDSVIVQCKANGSFSGTTDNLGQISFDSNGGKNFSSGCDTSGNICETIKNVNDLQGSEPSGFNEASDLKLDEFSSPFECANSENINVKNENHKNELTSKESDLPCTITPEKKKNVTNQLEISADQKEMNFDEMRPLRTTEFNCDSVNVDNYSLGNGEIDVTNEDFGDFGDFTNFTAENRENIVQTSDFNSHLIEKQDFQEDDEDDFGDFNDFKADEITSSNLTVKEPTVEETLKLMFEKRDENLEENYDDQGVAGLTDTLHSCLDDSSSVWGHLKELETSHALSYQWSNSTANKTFLSSLNIDCRNILIGGKWNFNMPRFAANLGANPLEPVKASESVSLSQNAYGQNRNGNGISSEDVVPAAQFDWNSSGLTNPLDGLEKENLSKPEESDVSSSIVGEKKTEGETGDESEEIIGIEDTFVKPFVDDVFSFVPDEPKERFLHPEEVPSCLSMKPSTIPSVSDSSAEKRNDSRAEAYSIAENFPDLSFLSARKLMEAANENMSKWKLGP